MAEYGLKIKNATGFVVIDGNYSNMALSAYGTLLFSGAVQLTNGVYFNSITVPGIAPVIALRSLGGAAAVLGSVRSGGSTTFNIICTTRDAVTYYVFDDATLARKFNTKYGLLVRNKNTGAVVFDSRCPYLRVLGSISGNTAGNPSALPASASFGSSAVAVLQAVRMRNDTYFVLPGTPPLIQPISATSFSHVSGGNVTISQAAVWTFPPAANNPLVSDANTTFMYFAVDVSGY